MESNDQQDAQPTPQTEPPTHAHEEIEQATPQPDAPDDDNGPVVEVDAEPPVANGEDPGDPGDDPDVPNAAASADPPSQGAVEADPSDTRGEGV